MYNDARLLDIDGSVRQKQKTKILLFQARRPPKTKKNKYVIQQRGGRPLADAVRYTRMNYYYFNT